MTLHLIKLCVGVDSVTQLRDSIESRLQDRRRRGVPVEQIHVTRMMPKRSDEILQGGSLYWVIKGAVQARQKILELRALSDTDGLKRCGIVLEPVLHPVRPVARKAFQGWRYLDAESAPADLSQHIDDDVPPELMAQLVSLGLV
ncbi:DUF1489 family protein [Notoacmeibacter ruber]|uniref:DUF1489 family protein n=1 Tax=Notoacmeibacter ruber TaxID=2670375 RepID=A0A3L7JB28_9HYPH|nr:DUF1489 domain-containing protein [Notoacmeibacter ruber]RLQ87947.1 DUF1489 family protein [Notoacmeibacter ruber]